MQLIGGRCVDVGADFRPELHPNELLQARYAAFWDRMSLRFQCLQSWSLTVKYHSDS